MLQNENNKVNPLTLSKPGINESSLDLKYIDLNPELLSIKNGILTSIIPGSKRYTIDAHGNIFDTHKQRYVSTYKDIEGYIKVTIVNDNKMKYTHQLHRLVLKTFRPISGSNYYQVNHIDKDPSNNRLDNLEWVTNGINKQHTHLEKRNGANNTDIVGMDCRNVFTGVVKTFTHLFECGQYLNLSKDVVANVADMPNKDFIHSSGWQIKRSYLKYKWPEITNDYIDKNLSNPPYVLKFIGGDDNELHEFASLTDVSAFLPCVLSSLTTKMTDIDNNSPNEIPSIFISTDKGKQLLFYLKRKYDPRPFKQYPTIWHAYNDGTNLISPVVRIDKNGNEEIYLSLEEMSRSLGVGKTTVHYKLVSAIDPKEWKYRFSNDGYIYAHYVTWYNLKSTKDFKDFVIGLD